MRLHSNPSPGELAYSGRRLIDAYFSAYNTWRATNDVATAASDRGEPNDAVRALEGKANAACSVACICGQALTDFVMTATRRACPTPPGDCIAMDLWPAAAVELDGLLWVAMQDPNGDAGDLHLTRVVLADVVRLPAEGGGQ